MFTWTFLSSFFGFQELLISFLRPKMLLNKLHVNVPLDSKGRALDSIGQALDSKGQALDSKG